MKFQIWLRNVSTTQPGRFFGGFFFLKIIQYFLNFFLSLRTVNIIQLLKWIIYLIYFIHFMNMFFILHIIFGCQKNIGKFLISCIHSFCCIWNPATIFQTKVHNRFSAWFLFFFITQQYLHMLIYLPARVYNQVYKGKYHFDGVSFETPHWHLPNYGDRSTNHESFPQSFKYTARIKSTPPGAHGVIEINFCSFLFWPLIALMTDQTSYFSSYC